MILKSPSLSLVSNLNHISTLNPLSCCISYALSGKNSFLSKRKGGSVSYLNVDNVLKCKLWGSKLIRSPFFSIGSKIPFQVNQFSSRNFNAVKFNVKSEVEHKTEESNTKKKIVFLGTPEVASLVLDRLLDESNSPDSKFEISAIVTQPPSSKGRGRKFGTKIFSAVEKIAREKNFPIEKIFTPETARDENFIKNISSLQPHLCITAAYGNFLPTKFLNIPIYGTVNIHPSLLPLYRGAAPVQRTIQNGDEFCGVCLLFTVKEMDAGPIIDFKKIKLDENIKAPELLEQLFTIGTNILLNEMENIFNGKAKENAKEQIHDNATHAPKVMADEGVLNFSENALVLHNKVRAFSGWPGTRTDLKILNYESGQVETISAKILTTRAISSTSNFEISNSTKNILEISNSAENILEITFQDDALKFHCDDGSILEVMEIQPASKKGMKARDFWNGLRGRKLFRF